MNIMPYLCSVFRKKTKKMTIRHTFTTLFILVSMICLLTSCEGILADIYDDVPPETSEATDGTLHLDATSWKEWHYVDLKKLQKLISETGKADAADFITTMPIPETLSGEWDGVSCMSRVWFDVFGEGLKNYRIEGTTPIDTQEEPATWDFAIHRENVRTNGGSAIKTPYTDIHALPASSRELLNQLGNPELTPDVLSPKDVWCDQTEMLLCYIGCQNMKINEVLSDWLIVNFPPVPPTYSHDRHVYLLRLNDGTYAALQLENYLNASGTKCHLTINYRYPY